MGSDATWIESQVAWDGRPIPAQRQAWMTHTRQQMIKRQTPAGRVFSLFIAGRRATPLQFKRQKCCAVAPEIVYFLDFYFKSFKLAVELDGGGHKNRRVQDEWRTELLGRRDIRVLRFPNERILEDMAAVVPEVIHAMLRRPGRFRIKQTLRKELRRIYAQHPGLAAGFLVGL